MVQLLSATTTDSILDFITDNNDISEYGHIFKKHGINLNSPTLDIKLTIHTLF